MSAFISKTMSLDLTDWSFTPRWISPRWAVGVWMWMGVLRIICSSSISWDLTILASWIGYKSGCEEVPIMFSGESKGIVRSRGAPGQEIWNSLKSIQYLVEYTLSRSYIIRETVIVGSTCCLRRDWTTCKYGGHLVKMLSAVGVFEIDRDN